MNRAMFVFVYSVLMVSSMAFGMKDYQTVLYYGTFSGVNPKIQSQCSLTVKAELLKNRIIETNQEKCKSYKFPTEHAERYFYKYAKEAVGNGVDKLDIVVTHNGNFVRWEINVNGEKLERFMEKKNTSLSTSSSSDGSKGKSKASSSGSTSSSWSEDDSLCFDDTHKEGQKEGQIINVKYTASYPSLSSEEQLKITELEYCTLSEDFLLNTLSHTYELDSVSELISKIKQGLEVGVTELDIVITNNGIRTRLIISDFPKQLEKLSPETLKRLGANTYEELLKINEKSFVSRVSPRMIKGVCLGALATCLVVYFAYKNNDMISRQFMCLLTALLPSRFRV